MLVQFFAGIAKIRLASAEDQVFGRSAREFAHQQRQMLLAGGEQNKLLVFNLVFPLASLKVLFFFAAGLFEPSVPWWRRAPSSSSWRRTPPCKARSCSSARRR
mgnify:CR=1 FL=1